MESEVKIWNTVVFGMLGLFTLLSATCYGCHYESVHAPRPPKSYCVDIDETGHGVLRQPTIPAAS